MANPADQGAFDLWITDRISFKVARPESGDTGTFDAPITDRLAWPEYAEAAAAAGGVIGQFAGVAWASVGQFATVAEASIDQIAGVKAN